MATTEVLSIRVPTETKRKFAEVCKEYDWEPSVVLRRWVEKVATHGEMPWVRWTKPADMAEFTTGERG
jgi:antitoxin component of RelBE/YafQ-DinJ toxin-antitoxin module